MKRRQFLRATSAPALIGAFPEAIFSKPLSSQGQGQGQGPGPGQWDAGVVAHILPTVSHDSFLIKLSFTQALENPPVLGVNQMKFKLQMKKHKAHIGIS